MTKADAINMKVGHVYLQTAGGNPYVPRRLKYIKAFKVLSIPKITVDSIEYEVALIFGMSTKIDPDVTIRYFKNYQTDRKHVFRIESEVYELTEDEILSCLSEII